MSRLEDLTATPEELAEAYRGIAKSLFARPRGDLFSPTSPPRAVRIVDPTAEVTRETVRAIFAPKPSRDPLSVRLASQRPKEEE